ncbi:MAG: iron ABC transporter permease [Micrococcales bacterium]|nr:iron ABC transporter permease [Micrococcales bacterium]
MSALITLSKNNGSLSGNPDQPSHPNQRRRRAAILLTGLSFIVLLLVVISAMVGQMSLTPAQIWSSLGRLVSGQPVEPGSQAATADAVLWTIRWPRLALAGLAGASLAVAGVLMQGAFGNPLAEPGVIGVSAGAAAGASAAVALGAGLINPWITAGAAFVGALVATVLLYSLSRSAGRTEVVTLVLMGIAVNAVAGAAVAFFTFMAGRGASQEIVFWQMGSLNGTRGAYLWLVAPLVLAGIAAAMGLGRQLDLLALGERSARHLGVDVERLRILACLVIAVLTASAVAFCGVIAFVGLVVPHLVRLVVGPSHRLLMPASALGGAGLLMLADLVARNAIAHADLPIGMLTALVGGPFFFYLLRRTRRRAGGWA